MVVVKASEGSADHAVAEVAGMVECGDSARELLPDPEVASAPCDLVAEIQEARRPAADSPFAGRRRGPDVSVDVAGEVETALWRRGDVKREFYPSHGSGCDQTPEVHLQSA